jgi:hypothetical protein
MSMNTVRPFLAALAVIAVTHCSACCQDSNGWGAIQGRIVYSDDAPQAVTLDIERDAEVCGKVGLVDESLVVNKENRGIRYVAIWLESKESVPIHPDLRPFAPETPVLDNRDCRFEPRMLAVRTGQTLLLKNSDPIAHNAAVYVRRTTPFSEVIPQNQPLEKIFAKAETQPTRVDCSIHAWMKSWLIISDHPYVAITDADGRFSIPQIPAGEWKFRFWHERSAYLQSLHQGDTPTPLSKGIWNLTIRDSEMMDLGELVAAQEQFAAKKK